MGDWVAVERKLQRHRTLHRVVRVMPTQVLLDDGERYRLKDGKQLGCLAERKWMTKIPLMKPATQAEIAAMLQRE